MNIVESVTTMDCNRRNATKKPLKAPTTMPMPMPISVSVRTDTEPSEGRLASMTLTSEITAAADRSNPPDRMTTVWPIAAIASVAPLVIICEMS